MNNGQLQVLLDRLAITSWQRWALIACAVVSATAASAVCAVVAGQQTGGAVAVIVVLAFAAAFRADSHIALIAAAVIVWQWIASAVNLATPWAIAVAGCLLVFHASIAIMAVTPITAVVGADVLRAWAIRVAVVTAATVAMWALVVGLDQASRPGRAIVTGAAFVTLGALVLFARWRLARVTAAHRDGM